MDAEHAFDKFYAENLGVDTENLLISQPDNGEQALEIADNLILVKETYVDFRDRATTKEVEMRLYESQGG